MLCWKQLPLFLSYVVENDRKGIDENIKTNHSIHYISNSESKAMSYEVLVWGLKTTLVFF